MSSGLIRSNLRRDSNHRRVSAAFSGVTNVGFFTLGCSEPAGCNATTNGTLLLTYEKAVTCCSTDKCNTVLLSAAPTTRMTLTAGLGMVVLASLWSVM